MTGKMIVFPNAKINIGLFVTEKRPDGFHNLETVFYPIGLADVLEVVPGKGEAGSYAFTSTGIDVGCPAEKNLIVKAYALLAEKYRLPAVQIHLHKLIPFGAGLGGGSADAAFMLKLLNDFFELHLPEEELLRYATALGSDCAFFIPNRPAFACGKGELLEPVELTLKAYRLVLVKPDFGVSTPDAYRGMLPAAASFDLRRLEGLPVEEWKQAVRNDFEKNVFRQYPRLASLKQRLYEGGALYASLTGSGSAVYGIFKREQQNLPDFPECWMWKEE